LKLYKVFCSSFHLWCSVIIEDSADIELYEEIVGNPAYSASSDTNKSDPVSFQFKEPRQTECREEDFFARARSRPNPRIISHAQAGKNIQEPRSCDTFVECGTSRMELYDNSTILGSRCPNTSTLDKFAIVIISVDLKASLQCVNAYSTANRILGVINRSIVYKSRNILLNLYKSLVCPHLEYCTVAWSPHYVKDKELLERVQRRFTRMMPKLKQLQWRMLIVWTL